MTQGSWTETHRCSEAAFRSQIRSLEVEVEEHSFTSCLDMEAWSSTRQFRNRLSLEALFQLLEVASVEELPGR